MGNGRQNTRAIRARNKAVVAAGAGVCHICGHPGADAADHVIPLARGGTDTMDNLRPAHHTIACPTCGIKCNRVKSDNPWAPIIRRPSGINWPGDAGGVGG